MSGGHVSRENRLWLRVLAATLLLQAVSAFLTRVAPTIAPYLMDEVGLPVSAIGHLSAIGTLGSMVFLLIGAPVIAAPVYAFFRSVLPWQRSAPRCFSCRMPLPPFLAYC
jgi:hypothetical protein